MATALTNDIGEYRMYWLAPGNYYLLAVASNNRVAANPLLEPAVIDQSAEPPDAFGPAFYPSGDDDSQAAPIRIEAGSELRALDFSLTRTKAVRVKGRVVNAATGQPVTGAVLDMRSNYLNGATRSFPLYANTDDEGNFEFHNAPPGKYMLSTSWTEPGFRSMITQQDLQIGNKDVSDLQIVLANRSISGRLIMERGEPLPQSRTVLLFTEGGGTSFGTGLQPDGTFSVSNVSTAALRVELTGFADNFFIRSARTGSRDVLREGLTLAENSIDSLEVIVASQASTVEGIVNDEAQSPVVGATVVLLPNAERRDRPDLFKTVTTDQSGRFIIRGAVPGDYKIFGWDDLEPNIYFDPSFMEKYEAQGKPVHIDEDSHVTVTIRAISVRSD